MHDNGDLGSGDDWGIDPDLAIPRPRKPYRRPSLEKVEPRSEPGLVMRIVRKVQPIAGRVRDLIDLIDRLRGR